MGGPEQSLTTFADQGPAEILADYGIAFSFFLYIADRYGHDFIQDFHLDSTAFDVATFQEFLTAQTGSDTFVEVLVLWQAALMTAGQINSGSPIVSSSYRAADLVFPSLPMSKLNWTTPEAYSTPGAPNNGADFIRLRDSTGGWLKAGDIDSLEFKGSSIYETFSY